MDLLDILALAGITLVAVVLILETGHFVARAIHDRNAAKRQMELVREVQEALARTNALVTREQGPQVPEVVLDEATYVDVGPVEIETPVAALSSDTADTRPQDGRPAPGGRGQPSPTRHFFPLTEPQRRLLQELASGQRPSSAGDRLRTEVTLEWLATLGFVQRGEGENEYTITPLGREVLARGPQAQP